MGDNAYLGCTEEVCQKTGSGQTDTGASGGAMQGRARVLALWLPWSIGELRRERANSNSATGPRATRPMHPQYPRMRTRSATMLKTSCLKHHAKMLRRRLMCGQFVTVATLTHGFASTSDLLFTCMSTAHNKAAVKLLFLFRVRPARPEDRGAADSPSPRGERVGDPPRKGGRSACALARARANCTCPARPTRSASPLPTPPSPTPARAHGNVPLPARPSTRAILRRRCEVP